MTSPLAGVGGCSGGTDGSDVEPQRPGHGGGGGGSCCLSSSCGPSELGLGARAQGEALRQRGRGRLEPGEGQRGARGVGGATGGAGSARGRPP